jgi:hypothetical protein
VKEEQIERVRSRLCFALVGVLHQQEIDPHRPLFDVLHSVLHHQVGSVNRLIAFYFPPPLLVFFTNKGLIRIDPLHHQEG